MTDGNFQFNVPGNGGRAYSVSGGDQHIYEAEPPEDNFRTGEKALEERNYPVAAARFEAYLVVSRSGKFDQPDDHQARLRTAHARFYAALALLGGARPEHKLPTEIEYILQRLMKVGENVGEDEPVVHLARVLIAVVVEDYYLAYGLQSPVGDVGTLARSVELVDSMQLKVLQDHLADAQGWTRMRLAERVIGLVPSQQQWRVGDPLRPEKVRKYFTITPARRSGVVPLMTGVGGALSLIVGAFAGGFSGFLLIVGGLVLLYYAGKIGLIYLEYRRQYAFAEPKPSSRQMYDWLAADTAYLQDLASRKLRLDSRLRHQGGSLLVAPQVIVGLPQEHMSADRRVLVQRDERGGVVADCYEVAVVFLTANMVSTYSALLDFYTGHVIRDESRENRYRDVTGLVSHSVPMPQDLQDKIEFLFAHRNPIDYWQTLVLEIVDGRSFAMHIGFRGPTLDENGEIAWDNNKPAAIIQRMVRAGKGGV